MVHVSTRARARTHTSVLPAGANLFSYTLGLRLTWSRIERASFHIPKPLEASTLDQCGVVYHIQTSKPAYLAAIPHAGPKKGGKGRRGPISYNPSSPLDTIPIYTTPYFSRCCCCCCGVPPPGFKSYTPISPAFPGVGGERGPPPARALTSFPICLASCSRSTARI
jgi:hypothetical protein